MSGRILSLPRQEAGQVTTSHCRTSVRNTSLLTNEPPGWSVNLATADFQGAIFFSISGEAISMFEKTISVLCITGFTLHYIDQSVNILHYLFTL
jgi:hypothetical protein